MEKLNFDFELSPSQKLDREELVKTLLKNSNVQAFLSNHQLDESFVSDNASKLNTWLMHLEKCKNCAGLHTCRQEETGYVLGLQLDPLLSFELQACAYQMDYLKQTEHKAKFSVLDCPEHYLLADVRNLLKVKADSQYIQSIKEIPAWLTQNQRQGLYIYGGLGVGKTYLAMAILNYYAKQNVKVAFVNVPELAYQFYSSYTEDDQRAIKLERLKNASIVVFDDIGAETYSSYFRDEVLFPLLNGRMEEKKMTLFTSNHDMANLAVHFRFNAKGDDESLKSRRLLERIERLTKPLYLAGMNRRNNENPV